MQAWPWALLWVLPLGSLPESLNLLSAMWSPWPHESLLPCTLSLHQHSFGTYCMPGVSSSVGSQRPQLGDQKEVQRGPSARQRAPASAAVFVHCTALSHLAGALGSSEQEPISDPPAAFLLEASSIQWSPGPGSPRTNAQGRLTQRIRQKLTIRECALL